MLTIQNIKKIIAADEGEQALQAMEQMEQDPALSDVEKALVLAEKGKWLWVRERRAQAITAYEEGARLDPTGPSAMLLEHSRDIMDFFNPDLLNP